jgi:uncharacterized zinc-type alcohol dehydrogenase-like protein
MSQIRGWAAEAAKKPLVPFLFDPGPLGDDEVEVAVDYCGLCHSDLSFINDEMGISRFPFIPGHEAIGRVSALGAHAQGLSIGQRVGVGWTAKSCMHCHECLSGDQHLCAESAPTIIGRHGAFADNVRAHWAWVIPVPDALDASCAGPLLCGGVTVFAPLAIHGIPPTARVGVVGIGGLGHLGLKFANAWGCDVTAFTSSARKADEARNLGAHHVVSSRDPKAIAAIARSLDLLLVTVNVPLDWQLMLRTLKPNGRMHVVGAILEPLAIPAVELIFGQKSVSGSPTGSPTMIASMLEFAARHKIAPHVEHFPMSRVNDALAHLDAGRARYRVVLDGEK